MPLKNAKMFIGLSGWMDGGQVSTGVIEYLVEELGAWPAAEIDPSDYYIYSFPGSMEISGLIRPRVQIEDGLVSSIEEPTNVFHCCPDQNLVLLNGREPNMRWRNYAECILTVADEFNVRELYFVGSVSAFIPHTREPIFWSSTTEGALSALIERHGLSATNYEGPSSFGTYLLTLAKQRGLDMATVVTAIPGYFDGKNVRGIEATTQKLVDMTSTRIDLSKLKALSQEYLENADRFLAKNPELADRVRKMEALYDNELDPDVAPPDGENDDLREWFDSQDLKAD